MHQKQPPANVATSSPAGWAEQVSAWTTRTAASSLRKRLIFDSSESRYDASRAWPRTRIRHTVVWSASTRQNNTLTVKKGKRHDRRGEGNRHSCRRLFLVPRGRIRRPQGRGIGRVRLHGRQDGEPQLRGGLLGRDRPRRGSPTHLRPEASVIQGNPRGVLRDPRSDHAQPPGQRCRDAVPFSNLLPFRRAEGSGGASHCKYGRCQDLRRSHRHRSRAGVKVLCGGGLPSGILPAKCCATLLRFCSQAESRKIPEAFSGKTEEMTYTRMSAVQSGARSPGPTAAHSQPAQGVEFT